MSSRGHLWTSVRWIARIGSLISLAVLAMFIFGGQESLQIPDWNQMVGFLTFPVGIILGMLVGWCREKTGGLITLVSLAGFYVWHWLSADKLPSGPWFLIFSLPGLLFLVAGILKPDLSSSKKTTNEPTS